jgi:TPR repeat protein
MKYGRYMPSLMVTFLSFAISMHMSDHALGIEAPSNRLFQRIYEPFPSQQYRLIPIEITFAMRTSLDAKGFYKNYIQPDGSHSPAYTYWWSNPKNSKGHDEYRLGHIFMKGIGFEINYEEAKFWLEKSAAREYPPGMELLAHLDQIFYDKGANRNDLPQYNNCKYLMQEELPIVKEKLASKEEPVSNPLSSFFSAIVAPFRNLDTPPEPLKDEKHTRQESDLTLIAKKKYDEGMESYNNKEYEKAKALFDEAAKYKHRGAQYMLGLFHYYGRAEVPQSYVLAISYFELAAMENKDDQQQQAFPDAFFMLGNMYISGEGVLPDPEKAHSYFRKYSTYSMGPKHLRKLTYVEQATYKLEEGLKLYCRNDFMGAKALFEEAAAMDNADAHFWLGVCIHFGFCRTETEQDYKKIAANYYIIAAKNGVEVAINMIEGIKDIAGFQEYLKDIK